MRKQKAAPRTLQRRRAYLSCSRDMQTIAQIERAEFWAGIVIAIAFGLMFFVGLM